MASAFSISELADIATGARVFAANNVRGVQNAHVSDDVHTDSAGAFTVLWSPEPEGAYGEIRVSAPGYVDFALDQSPALEKLEQAVFELSRLIANLAAIDGAVILDKRLGLLGFGAEVSPELASPARVWRALDTEGKERELDDIENVGTRHRAAYRFVSDRPHGLALVISHDGGVSFVANHEGEVVFWQQSVSP